MEEIYADADAVVYGKIVRIEFDARAEGAEYYTAIIRVERSWKGSLQGDVTLTERLDWMPGSSSANFFFRCNYVAFLHKLPDQDAYSPGITQMVSLPVKPKTNSPFGAFGDYDPNREKEPNLELLEFLERKVGNDAEAKRLHDLRMAPILEQERIAKEAAQKIKEEADFVAAALAEFENAQKAESLVSRKSMLLSLKQRLKDHFDPGSQELKGKIFAELSVIDTLLTNGIKNQPPK